MPIHPRQMASGPQGRVLEKLANLEREVRQMRAARANQPQHGYAENIAGQSGISAGSGSPVVLVSVAITVPTTAHRVFLSPSVRLTMTNNTSEATAAWTTDDPSFAGVALSFGGVLNSTTATTVSPGAANWTAAQSEFWNQGFFIDAYNYPNSTGAAHVPAPGDRTYNLVVYRNIGTATITADQARLWVGVL